MAFLASFAQEFKKLSCKVENFRGVLMLTSEFFNEEMRFEFESDVSEMSLEINFSDNIQQSNGQSLVAMIEKLREVVHEE